MTILANMCTDMRAASCTLLAQLINMTFFSCNSVKKKKAKKKEKEF